MQAFVRRACDLNTHEQSDLEPHRPQQGKQLPNFAFRGQTKPWHVRHFWQWHAKGRDANEEIEQNGPHAAHSLPAFHAVRLGEGESESP